MVVMSQTIRWQNRSGHWIERLIGALSPLVLLQCSAQWSQTEVVRPLEDKHIGIATIDAKVDVSPTVYRVRWVSFKGELSWGPTLEGKRALEVSTSPRGDRFVVLYSVPYGESGLLIADSMAKELWRMPYELGAPALGL